VDPQQHHQGRVCAVHGPLRRDGALDQIGARLSALMPAHADPQAVADEIARIAFARRIGMGDLLEATVRR
jgi:hypothetical protein